MVFFGAIDIVFGLDEEPEKKKEWKETGNTRDKRGDHVSSVVKPWRKNVYLVPSKRSVFH